MGIGESNQGSPTNQNFLEQKLCLMRRAINTRKLYVWGVYSRDVFSTNCWLQNMKFQFSCSGWFIVWNGPLWYSPVPLVYHCQTHFLRYYIFPFPSLFKSLLLNIIILQSHPLDRAVNVNVSESMYVLLYTDFPHKKTLLLSCVILSPKILPSLGSALFW